MKKINTIDLSRTEWEHLIDEWIFNEKHRAILKRKIHDGVPFEKLSKEFGLSTQQCKNIVYRGLAELDRHA